MMSSPSVSRMVLLLVLTQQGILVQLMSAISSSGLHSTLCIVRNLGTISTYKYVRCNLLEGRVANF